MHVYLVVDVTDLFIEGFVYKNPKFYVLLYNIQFWFNLKIIYRMYRVGIQASACKISKQLDDLKIFT